MNCSQLMVADGLGRDSADNLGGAVWAKTGGGTTTGEGVGGMMTGLDVRIGAGETIFG